MSTKINYLGLTLESPIIVASCGLTNNIENIKEMEAFGAGAVVLKSLLRNRFPQKLIKSVRSFPIMQITVNRTITLKITSAITK